MQDKQYAQLGFHRNDSEDLRNRYLCINFFFLFTVKHDWLWNGTELKNHVLRYFAKVQKKFRIKSIVIVED